MRIKEGVELIRTLEPKFAEQGYHLGLTGSVLFKGRSEKDMDVICYPHDMREKVFTFEELATFLQTLGFHVLNPAATSNYDFNKEVHVAYLGDQRVDFFHLR